MISILLAVVVGAFIFISTTAILAPGEVYEENTFMYYENIRSSVVQEISATALSIGSIFVIVLVGAIIVCIVGFIGSSVQAFGGVKTRGAIDET